MKDIAVDATNLYWYDFGTNAIMTMAKTGGTPTVLVSGQPIETGLVVADGYLYWSNSIAGTVDRFKL